MESNPFDNLTFEKFRDLAKADSLSHHEKVGFPNIYREGKEELIFADIFSKLASLKGTNKTILEIGPGCSRLPQMLADICAENGHTLLFIDSEEMLSLLPNASHIHKFPGRYPDIPNFFDQYLNSIDAVIAYSVIQYIFAEGNLWKFMDCTLSLLADGGEVLLGDIPNNSMRKRFFSSHSGAICHKAFTGKDELPIVNFNVLEPDVMDDSVVISILSRARAQGFHGWVVPQSNELPMANRREDILIKKP